MARTLSGGDRVETSIGGLVGINSGAHTLACIARRGADGAWHTPLSIETSGGSSKLALQFSDTNEINLVIGSSGKDTNVAINTADGWVFVAATRASGSSVPRGHKYVYSSNTWTRDVAAAATGGDSTDLTGGKAKIGRWQTTDNYNGDLLIVGAWKRALSDAEIDLLPFSLAHWLAAAPDELWPLYQADVATGVISLTGSAHQTSRTGTSVATGSPPVFGWGADLSWPPVASGGGATDKTLADTAAGTDAAAVEAQATLADTAAGTDALTAAVTLTLADAAAGVDALTVTASAVLADTAAGVDALAVAATVVLAETAAATDAPTATATVGLADVAASADDLAVGGAISQVSLTDTAVAADALARVVVPVGPVARPTTAAVARPKTTPVDRPT